MASLPYQPCLTPGCRALVRGQARCDAHAIVAESERATRYDANRDRASDRGYDSQWATLRRQVIAASPTCQLCGVRPSRLVHHWNEVRQHPHLRLAKSNLVAVCASCHQRVHHESKK